MRLYYRVPAVPTPTKRFEIRNVPEWAFQAAEQWCEHNGTTVHQFVRDTIVNLATQEQSGISVPCQPHDMARYQKLCRAMGLTAEQRLSMFIRDELERKT